MPEVIINIANIISTVILLLTLIVIAIVKFRKNKNEELNVFFIFSICLLLLVSIFNLLEHFSILVFLDLYEDSLELLFIPFIIFSLYASNLTFEYKLRSKAELFSSKIISTSPAVTFIYDLGRDSITFIDGNLWNDESSGQSSVSTGKNSLIKLINEQEFNVIKTHFNEIKSGSINKFPNVTEYKMNDNNNIRYINSHEAIFSQSDSGKPLEIVCIAIDVTDRKLAEQEVLKYQNHLENLVKSRTIELENSNNELKTINDQLQKTNQELRKINLIVKNQSDRIETLNSKLLLQNQELEETNKVLVQKQNELELTMSQLSHMQNQLIQSEKLSSLGVLMAGIAHEINNPLNYICNGMVELKLSLNSIKDFTNDLLLEPAEKYVPDSDFNTVMLVKKYDVIENINIITTILGYIQTGIDRIIDIISSLRNYTRTGNETYELTDLHSVIDAVLVMLSHEYKNRIQIQKDLSNIPKIECQTGKINQVIMNLLSNAIQAIEKEGVIRIITEKSIDDKKITIRIKDTGIGISEEIKNNIFDPFFTTKKAGQGTGLGLSICYDIIQAHNGEIGFTSNVSEGSEFTISLPVKRFE